MDLWLCNCEGYPGMRNPKAAADWIASHQIAAEAWYVNSPNLTAAETRRLEKVGNAVERNRVRRRLREVVRLVSLGCTGREIAKILGLSLSTVENHRARAMKVLQTDKTALITRIAIKYKVSGIEEKLTLSEKRRSGRKQDGWN